MKDIKQFLKEEHITESCFQDNGVPDLIESLILKYHSQHTLSREMSRRVAKLIIQIRDLFIEAKDNPLDTMEEIWHFLYQIASPNYDKMSDDVWKEIESIALAEPTAEKVDKVEQGEQQMYGELFNVVERGNGYMTIVRRRLETASEDPLTDHEQIIDELCNKIRQLSQPQPVPTDEMVIDLKQYITNLMYNAYNDGKQELSTAVFDTWVEAEWDNIDHFFKSRDGKIGQPESKEEGGKV